MGRHDSDLRALTQAIIERHAGPQPDSSIRTRTSADGNFLALTYLVRATSRRAARHDLSRVDGLQIGIDGVVIGRRTRSWRNRCGVKPFAAASMAPAAPGPAKRDT